MSYELRRLTNGFPANDNGESAIVACPECRGAGEVSRRIRLIDRPGYRKDIDDCGHCGGSGECESAALEGCPACDGAGGTWDEWGSTYTTCDRCHEGRVTADQWQEIDAWLVNEFG